MCNVEVNASAIPLFAGATIWRLTIIIIRVDDETDAACGDRRDDFTTKTCIFHADEAFRGEAGGCSQFAYLYKYRYRRYGTLLASGNVSRRSVYPECSIHNAWLDAHLSPTREKRVLLWTVLSRTDSSIPFVVVADPAN